MNFIYPSSLKNLLLLLAAGLAVIFYTDQASAQPQLDLYLGEVSVEQQDASQRDTLLRQAFAQVLVRLTGNPDIVSEPEASALLKQAPELVERFGYASKRVVLSETSDTSASTESDGKAMPIPSSGNSPSSEGAGQQVVMEQLVFQASFIPDAVDNLVRSSGLPFWSRQRPLVMVWLALDDDGRRRLLDHDQGPGQAKALVEVANARGVPIAFPRQDASELATVDVADVFDGFDDEVVEASRRYGARHVVIARIHRQGVAWDGVWSLLHGDRGPEVWDIEGIDLNENFSKGMQTVSNALAARYSVLTSHQGPATQIDIEVLGVSSGLIYAKVNRHLRSVEVIKSVDLLSLSSGIARFRLSVAGGLEALEQGLALEDMLRRAFTGGDTPVFRYVDTNDGNSLTP